jgi:hypothetical protein
MSTQFSKSEPKVRHLLVLTFAIASLFSLAGAMLSATDHDPQSDFDVPGFVVVIVSLFSVFFAPQYVLIAVFTGILLISTVLIVKQGFEGLGTCRIILILCGGLHHIFWGVVTDTILASGYWCWLASFVLSLVAHLLAYRHGGTLDAAYTFREEEH